MTSVIQTSLGAVLGAHHVQDVVRSVPIKSKIGSEPSQKSPFQAFHPAVDEHEIRCHGEGGPQKPSRDLPWCRLPSECRQTDRAGEAEQRRAMAVAAEQEMRARVVEAEAEVPRAMAEASRQGHLGVMDYYRMKNAQADTTMRDAIARGDDTRSPGPKTQE